MRGTNDVMTDEKWVPKPWVRALHILTLSAFAFAQPLFDLLGRNASFFVAHRASRLDIIALSLITLFGPPLVLLSLTWLIARVSRRGANAFYIGVIGLLAAIAIVPPVVRATGLRWVLAAVGGILVAVIVVVAYRRASAISRFFSLVGPAVIVFPLLFLFASPVRSLVLTQASVAPVGGTPPAEASKTPVTIALFDELSLSSIVNPRGEIDRKRFPGFARLADRATWYQDATTAGLRTDQAVPAILTGRRVPRRQIPSSFTYPQNLFTLLAPTHRIDAREFVTQLCPPELCSNAAGDATTGRRALFTDAAIVYGHLLLPSDLAERWLPPLGDRWAGFTRAGGDGGGGGGDPVRSWLRSALTEAKARHEGRVFEDFLDNLRPPKGKATFSWMHLQLPHPPWRYLPSGQTYAAGDVTPGYHNFRFVDDAYLPNEVLQRSMLQSVYADHLMTELLDRLEETKLFDDTMLIVLADHGATWGPDATRREVDGPQKAGLLGIPLFIKYPQQESGGADKRSAETIDIVPTVADVVGVDLPWESHGSSLLRGPRRTDKRVFDGDRERVVEHNFADVRRRAQQIEDLFGPSGGSNDLFGFGPHRDLIGRRVSSFDVAKSSRPTTLSVTEEAAYEGVDPKGPVLPAFFRARLSGSIPKRGTAIAVALNGVIAGVGQTFVDEDKPQIAVILQPAYFLKGKNTWAVYSIGESGKLTRWRS